MDCRKAERLLDALAAGELRGSREREVREHVEECPSCRESSILYARSREALLAAGSVAPAVTPDFHRALSRRLDEVDRAAGVMPRRLPVRWHIVGGVAAAAAAVFIISVYVIPAFSNGRQVITAQARPDVADTPVATTLATGYQSALRYAPGRRSVESIPYINVDLDGSGPAGTAPVRQQAQPRLMFPSRPWVITGTGGGAVRSVTWEDYKSLQDRMRDLEARVEAIEHSQPAPTAP